MPEVFDEASRLLVLNFMHELFCTKVKIDIDKFDEIAVTKEKRTQTNLKFSPHQRVSWLFEHVKRSKPVSVLSFVAKKNVEVIIKLHETFARYQ